MRPIPKRLMTRVAKPCLEALTLEILTVTRTAVSSSMQMKVTNQLNGLTWRH